MGINWVMEIVSWGIGGPDYLWYFTDIINTLQGVIIFLIFVLEPRVRRTVWKQWGPKLSQILCRKQHPFPNVMYKKPNDNAV
jgi:G protein-coupled receptor Mth (Methuselah protein)